MRKITFLLLGIALSLVCLSCSVQYQMTGLKKLEFKHPVDWNRIDTGDDYTYDHIFKLQNENENFELYLRTVYSPLINSNKWLRNQRKTSKNKGYKSGKIRSFSSSNFKWHFMETEDMLQKDGKNIPIKIRYYIAREEKSPRMIQCFVVAEGDNFKNLPENKINKFLDSFAFKSLKIADKDQEHHVNYFSSAAEAVFLRRGEKLKENQEYDRAINVFESLLKRPITDKLKVKLHYLISLCFFEKGVMPYIQTKDARNWQIAIREASKAKDKDKQYYQAYYNVGMIYLNMKDLSNAKKFLKQAISNCPKESKNYNEVSFYFDESKAPLRYKRSISKMFSKENRITGFVHSANDPMVIISDKLYKIGDIVSGHTILEVRRDKAFLRYDLRVDEFVSGDLIIEPAMMKK